MRGVAESAFDPPQWSSDGFRDPRRRRCHAGCRTASGRRSDVTGTLPPIALHGRARLYEPTAGDRVTADRREARAPTHPKPTRGGRLRREPGSVSPSSVGLGRFGYAGDDGDRVSRDSLRVPDAWTPTNRLRRAPHDGRDPDEIRAILTPAGTSGVGTIYVLAPVHDRRSMTEQFVRCLMTQTDQGFHLTVVDDGSRDGTSEMVRAIMPTATIIRGMGDWWWAGSLQQARQWLQTQPAELDDLVLIANDDTTFEPDFLERARAAMRAHPHSLLLAEAFSGRTGESKGVGMHVDWRKLSFRPTHDPNAIDCFATRGLFLRRDDFLSLGPFHTVLLPHYLSDYEFSIRAARRGLALRTDPRVRLTMDEAATGIRVRDLSSPRAYLRSVLSKKATENPFYWTTFVILASPRRYLVPNLMRVWQRFAKGFVRSARGKPEPAR